MCRFDGNSHTLLATLSFAILSVNCGRVHHRAATQSSSHNTNALGLDNGIQAVIKLNLLAPDWVTYKYVRTLH